MKKIYRHVLQIVGWVSLLGIPVVVWAHEAYVLPTDLFWHDVALPPSLYALHALLNPGNLYLIAMIVCGILLLMFLNFIFRLTAWGSRVHSFIERFAFTGPLFVRLAIATSFFFSAYSWSFLGPELPITRMPYASLIRGVLFLSSILILLGLYTRIAASMSLIVFTIGFVVFGMYLITYFNYLGEIIVLTLFGMRTWSLDRLLFGKLKYLKQFEKYETTIVRICYGIALVYAGITIKFLHPALTLQVVNDWNLTQFHWLFPGDPLLVVFGAGLSEVVIGLFIIIGFEMRLTVLISLFYITLSLFYFRELVWPHLMLYGISFNLLVQPEIFTLDHLFFKEHRLRIRWWKRLLHPHTTTGKSAHTS